MKATTFIKHSAIYGLGTVVVQASGIILLTIYTKALTPADYGTLEILTRLGEILAIVLLMPGIRQGVLAYYRQSEAPETRQAVVGASLALILAVAILGGFGLSLAAGSVGQLLGIDKPALVRLGVLIAIADCVGRIPLALTQARIEAVRFVSFNCTQLLVKIILSLGSFVCIHYNVSKLCPCYGLPRMVEEPTEIRLAAIPFNSAFCPAFFAYGNMLLSTKLW